MLGIVIPAYKRRDCLREALQSLCCQTYNRFFVIVVDDHSPDPLSDVVKEFEDRLHIIYKYADENGGPGAARQIGLNICYDKDFSEVMFLDSDDMLFPQAVARLTHEIRHTNADLVSSKIWTEDKNGCGNYIEASNKTWLHGKIFRVSYLKKNNISFPKMRTNEDLAFNLMAIESTENGKIIDEALYLFRHENNSITRSVDKPLSLFSYDYITAIYEASKFLQANGKFGTQMIVNSINTYNYYQAMLSFSIEPTEEIKEQTRYLINLPEVQDFLKSPSSMGQFCGRINNYFIHDKKIYYYKQTFEEWLKEFTDESSNN